MIICSITHTLSAPTCRNISSLISGSLLYYRAVLHTEQVLKKYLSNDIMGIKVRQMDFLYLLGSEELLPDIHI